MTKQNSFTRFSNQRIMKNHLVERLISGLWLSLLAYFFIYNLQSFSSTPPSTLFYFGILISIFFFLLGYFKAYKKLLLPADKMNIFPLQCIAGILSSILLGGITWLILSSIFEYFTSGLQFQSNFVIFVIIFFVIALLAFLIGWFFLYKLLLLPKVTYVKEHPSYRQRIISAIWFGVIGYILVNIFKKSIPVIPIYGFLLASYFGYTAGYSILLLPSSTKGLLKSIMTGFIWSSYALLIVWLMPSYSFFYATFHSLSSDLISNLGGVIAFLFIFYPIACLFVCIPTIIFSLILFLLSRFWARI